MPNCTQERVHLETEMLFKMYAPYTYGLPKNYEDIFNKFSKIQKPTEAIHTKPFRNSQKHAVYNEDPNPAWSPHITKRKSNQKKYVGLYLKCFRNGPKIKLDELDFLSI